MLTYFIVSDVPTEVGTRYLFDNDDARHAMTSLRTAVGEEFILTDGHGAWARVQAAEVGKKSITCSILDVGRDHTRYPTMSVVQALPKSDRAKEALEMLTEGGVDRIIPWSAARSIGKGDKREKWQSTLREATKQSRRTFIPEITELASTAEVVRAIKESDIALVFHQGARKKLSDIALDNAQSVLIIIGPEGGLTESEIEEFTNAGAQLALMGRPVLRTAHAGLAALSAINALLKVW